MLLGILALAVTVAGCHRAGSAAAPAYAALGMRAPDFALRMVGADRVIRLSAYRGTPVILNFFCGCHSCFEVGQAWTRAGTKAGRARRLAVMFNAETFDPMAVRRFREATHFDAPILADVRSQTAIHYHSVDCPSVWVIDRDGVIRYHNPDRMAPADQIVAGALHALEKIE